MISGFVYTAMIKNTPSSHTVITNKIITPIYAEDLGKTPKQLQKKYPDLFMETDKFGLVVGKHKLDGAYQTIWFVADNKVYKAFRLRSWKKTTSLNEEEITGHFAKRYGRSFDSQCSGKSALAINKCHYKWWIRKNVTLDLYSRFKTDGSVTLSAITTDTHLVNRHFYEVKKVLPTQ